MYVEKNKNNMLPKIFHYKINCIIKEPQILTHDITLLLRNKVL